MTPVKVSVIVISFNGEGYLAGAIDSALDQSYRSHEVIVVDDGSTDGTRALVQSYGDRVRYVYTNNGGSAHARNVGMAHARGEYFTFLDSDDLLHPYAVELEAAALDRYPELGMVYAEMSGFDDHGFFDRFHLKKYHQSAYRDPRVTYDTIFDASVPLGEAVTLPAALLREDASAATRRLYTGRIFDSYLTNIIVFQNNLMMRRTLLPVIGVRNERLPLWQELDYAMRICRVARVGFVDVPTYKLRYHPGQISSTAGERGRSVWAHKQRELLRVIKRHVFADESYYEQHRPRLDRHLAQLHRAVAVPLMLLDGGSKRSATYARRARAYLRRCFQYGHTEWRLWLLTYTPGPVRRLGVSVIEEIRKLKHAVRGRWARAA